MAVYTKLKCVDCGQTSEEPKETNPAPQCPKCGGTQKFSKKWGVRLYINGKKYSPYRWATKGEAKIHEEEVSAQRRSGEITTKPTSLTVEKAFETVFKPYLETKVRRKEMVQRSANRYIISLTHNLLPLLKGVLITQVDRQTAKKLVAMREVQVKTFKNGKVKAPSAATINRDIAALSALLTACVDEQILGVNKLHGMKVLLENNRRERYLEKDEIDRLLAACVNPRLRRAIMIALNTGLRLEGCLTLRWSEINMSKRTISKIVKGGKLVHLYINDTLYNELKEAWQERKSATQEYVIPAPRNHNRHILTTCDIGMRESCELAGIKDFTFHDLRHTYATHFLEAHPDQIEALAVIMGHSGAYMTRRYAHVVDRVKERLMMGMELGGPSVKRKTD